MITPAVRRRIPELMDQPDFDAQELRQALDGFGRANFVGRTAAALWPRIQGVAATGHARPVRILDIACGGGHVASSLSRRARAAGFAVDILGCDISPVAIDYARTHVGRSGDSGVRFQVLDVVHDPLPDGFDVVYCSLFLHHLGNDEAVALLGRMRAAARSAVLVSDLQRTYLGYVFAWVGCRLLSRSRAFCEDAGRSVASAFTLAEAADLAVRAGLLGAECKRCWPQRFLLTWSRRTTEGDAGDE